MGIRRATWDGHIVGRPGVGKGDGDGQSFACKVRRLGRSDEDANGRVAVAVVGNSGSHYKLCNSVYTDLVLCSIVLA